MAVCIQCATFKTRCVPSSPSGCVSCLQHNIPCSLSSNTTIDELQLGPSNIIGNLLSTLIPKVTTTPIGINKNSANANLFDTDRFIIALDWALEHLAPALAPAIPRPQDLYDALQALSEHGYDMNYKTGNLPLLWAVLSVGSMFSPIAMSDNLKNSVISSICVDRCISSLYKLDLLNMSNSKIGQITVVLGFLGEGTRRPILYHNLLALCDVRRQLDIDVGYDRLNPNTSIIWNRLISYKKISFYMFHSDKTNYDIFEGEEQLHILDEDDVGIPHNANLMFEWAYSKFIYYWYYMHQLIAGKMKVRIRTLDLLLKQFELLDGILKNQDYYLDEKKNGNELTSRLFENIFIRLHSNYNYFLLYLLYEAYFKEKKSSFYRKKQAEYFTRLIKFFKYLAVNDNLSTLLNHVDIETRTNLLFNWAQTIDNPKYLTHIQELTNFT